MIIDWYSRMLCMKSWQIQATDIETTKEGIPFCISFCSASMETKFFRWDPYKERIPQKAIDILCDPRIWKVLHYGQFDIGELKRYYGIKVRGQIHDTCLMLQIGDPLRKNYKLKDVIADEPFNRNISEYEKVKILARRGLGYNEMPKKLMRRYNIKDSIFTMVIFLTIAKRVINDRCYQNERKLIRTTIDMESAGIRIDTYFTKIKNESWLEDIEHQARKIKRAYGVENPNSTAQWMDLFYGEDGLGFTVPEFKGQKQTTSDLALKLLKRNYNHPVLDDLTKYRQLCARQKFVNALLGHKTNLGFIFPKFNQMGSDIRSRVKTGRFSSTDPNFQNLPRGSEIRELILPRKNHYLLDLDYKQIEMMVYAYLANDIWMKNVFSKKGDIHTLHKKKFVDPYMRDKGLNRQIAKGVGFGILYGVGAPGLWKYLARQNIIIDMGIAEKLLDGWHMLHPSLRTYKMELHDRLRRKGFIEDMFGRKYFLMLAKSYIAVNYMVQGTSAGIIKEVMPRMNKFCKEHGAKLILTIHDELVLDVPNEYLKTNFNDDAKKLMESPGSRIGIPIEADYVVMQNNWGQKK